MGTIHAILFLSKTAQKMKFSIKEFLSKCDQIRSFLRIWSNLLMKFLMENFFFCKQIKKFKSTHKYKLSQTLTLTTLSIK